MDHPNLDHNPHGRGDLSLDLNPVFLRVNVTNLDQDLDQNPRVNGALYVFAQRVPLCSNAVKPVLMATCIIHWSVLTYKYMHIIWAVHRPSSSQLIKCAVWQCNWVVYTVVDVQ